MNSPSATRLCAACGLCCNGVMFYSMRLQPADQARTLASLGLKVKRKGGEHHMLQPCPAHDGSHCTIYAQRPERCRMFDCRQLQAVAAGEIDEAAALEKISEAQRRVTRVRELFLQAGDTRETKAFVTRFETIFTPPLDPSPQAGEIRRELAEAMAELEKILTADFRLEPAKPGKAYPCS